VDIFESEDIGVGDGGKNSNLIESVSNLSIVSVSNFDFFHGIDTAILFSLNFIDRSECSFSDFGDDIEILHFVN